MYSGFHSLSLRSGNYSTRYELCVQRKVLSVKRERVYILIQMSYSTSHGCMHVLQVDVDKFDVSISIGPIDNE